jgi:hypothetical protein
MKAKLLVVGLAALLIVACPGFSAPQGEDAMVVHVTDPYLGTLHARGQNSLKGLTRLYLSVEPPSAEARQDGLSSSVIQTDVQPLLTKAGIHVLTDKEFLGRVKPGAGVSHLPPSLDITINTAKRADGLYAYSIALALDQEVALVRVRNLPGTRAATWSTFGTVGMVQAEHLGQVREEVKKDIGYFLDDYRSVNPKK